MKWVKTAIGAVIAISVIPMIVLSVFNLTQEKVREEVVTFEVLTYDDVIGKGTVTSGTYSKILLYAEIDDDDVKKITNVLSILINEVEFFNIDNYYISIASYPISGKPSEITFYDGLEGDFDIILHDDTISTSVRNIVFNDTVEITFEVTTQPVLSGVTATLVSLVSLVFISGILYSFYNVRMKEGE